MQPNFTLKKTGKFFRFTSALLALALLINGKINAQQYVNSNLSTGTPNTVGVAAPAGFTWSEINAATLNFGLNANAGLGFSLADDFTISCGSWNVTKITVFAYSTGFAGPVSPFNDMRVAIYNANPSTNPAPIFGDRVTNRFSASSSAAMYRVAPGASDLQRHIWKIEANIPSINLTSGTYWIEFSVGGPAANFTPAGTVSGTTTQPGNNGLQRDPAGVWTPVVDGGPQDFHFIVDYTAAACTGTPNPGNTISSVGTVCPGIPFNLSLQNCTPGTGITYQWQSGPSAAGPWTNIPGATSSTLTTTHSASTYYQATVTCGGNTGTSTPIQVLLTDPSGCYCTPPNMDCTDDDEIIRVRISTLDNASGCSAPSGYSNFTALPAPTVYAGATNPITLNFNGVWSKAAAVWIDYNHNGQFEVSEFTSVGAGVGTVTEITGNINIPASALLGNTRMRVRTKFGNTPLWTGTEACTNPSGFGETEDYTVNIQPCVPVSVTSNPANVSVVCGNTASFTVATTGSLPSYVWEYRPNASSAWQFVPNAAPYSGVNTATLTINPATAAQNGYQYRAVVQGGCSATDFSGAATLTVTPIVPVVNPASASICTGSVQQLSLTNSASAPTTVSFSSGPVSVAIPESPGGVASGTSTINVAGIPAGAVITEMKVTLNMTHNWVGDVCYVVKAPNNNVLNLDYFLSQTGAGGTNFVNTVISSSGTAALNTGVSPGFTGTFKADAGTGAIIPAATAGPVGYIPNVTTWNGLYSTPNGAYTLAFFDYFVDPDPGTFTGWSIEITYESPVLVQGTWTGPAGTMWTNPGATVPYTGTPATTIYVNPTVSSNYQVSFNTAAPCVSATATIPVSVSNPVTAIVHPANTAACVGSNATFTTSAGGGPLTYQWQVSVDGGLTWTNIAGATNSTLTVSSVTQSMNNNRYRAVISAGPCGSANSNAAVLTVNALPTVTISAPDVSLAPGQATTITGASTPAAGANSWTWTLNGSSIAGTTNTQNVNIDGLGTYRARAVDGNGCANFSNELTIGAEASDRLWIYPNPSPGAFQVRLYYGGPVTERRVVTIFNSSGQRMMQKEFTLDNVVSPYLRMDFDLSHMAAGTYVVKVHNTVTGKITSGLVVVQHAN